MAREWHGIDRLRLDKFYMVRGRGEGGGGGGGRAGEGERRLQYNWPGFLNCAKLLCRQFCAGLNFLHSRSHTLRLGSQYVALPRRVVLRCVLPRS